MLERPCEKSGSHTDWFARFYIISTNDHPCPPWKGLLWCPSVQANSDRARCQDSLLQTVIVGRFLFEITVARHVEDQDDKQPDWFPHKATSLPGAGILRM